MRQRVGGMNKNIHGLQQSVPNPVGARPGALGGLTRSSSDWHSSVQNCVEERKTLEKSIPNGKVQFLFILSGQGQLHAFH
jgi:hypothetical protein